MNRNFFSILLVATVKRIESKATEKGRAKKKIARERETNAIEQKRKLQGIWYCELGQSSTVDSEAEKSEKK